MPIERYNTDSVLVMGRADGPVKEFTRSLTISNNRMLAILTNISYLHSCFQLTDRIQTRASRIQSGHSKLHNIRTASKSTTATSTESLIASADRPHNTQQPAMNSGGSSVRLFEKRLLRAITDRKLKSRRRPAAQTRIPSAHGTAQCKAHKVGWGKLPVYDIVI